MASPSSVCLGCRSVRSLSWSLLLSFFCSRIFLPLLVVFVSLSLSFCRRCADVLFCFSVVLLPLAVAHVVGGGGGIFCAGGYVCCGVCVFSSPGLASKKAREVPPCACVACFFFYCPVLLLLVHMVVFYVVLVVFDARARAATASLRIRFYSFLRRSFAVSSS